MANLRYGNMEKVAFFDIDGTLIKGRSSERIFFWYLIEKGIVTLRDLIRYAGIFLKKLFTFKGIYLRKNKSYIRGKDYKMIVSLAHDCFNERISKYISDVALNEIRRLRHEGYRIILLSGTLDPIMECFKRYCNADEGIATTLKMINGIITGEIDGIYAYDKGKAEILKNLVKGRQIDLSISAGYGNEYIDIPFLRMVGNPVAVNAGFLLKRHANKHKWKVMEF